MTGHQLDRLKKADKSQDKVSQPLKTIKSSSSLQHQMLSAFERPGSAGPIVAYTCLCLVSFVIVCAHGFIPKVVWSNFDIFSMDHYIKPGASAVKRRTPLGFAFSVAYIPIAAAVVIGLFVSNRPSETRTLQTFHQLTAKVGQLSLRVTLPLETTDPDNFGSCPNVTMAAVTGLVCKQQWVFDKTTCAFTGNNCTIGLKATFIVSVPWNQRWVKWDVTTETAKPNEVQTLSGNVVCATSEKLIRDTTTIDVQAVPSYYTDTTSNTSGVTRSGYEIYPLPHKPPTTGLVAEVSTEDWDLEITLRRSALVNVVSISLPLTQFQMLSLCLTTVLSFLGIWRQGFIGTELWMWLLQPLSRRCKCKKKRARTAARGQTGGGADVGVPNPMFRKRSTAESTAPSFESDWHSSTHSAIPGGERGSFEGKNDEDDRDSGVELQTVAHDRTASITLDVEHPTLDAMAVTLQEQKTQLKEQRVLAEEQQTQLEEQWALAGQQQTQLEEQRALAEEQRALAGRQQTQLEEQRVHLEHLQAQLDWVLKKVE